MGQLGWQLASSCGCGTNVRNKSRHYKLTGRNPGVHIAGSKVIPTHTYNTDGAHRTSHPCHVLSLASCCTRLFVQVQQGSCKPRCGPANISPGSRLRLLLGR